MEKQLWATPDGVGYSIRHEPGKPLWAAMIEKAYLRRFAPEDGYGTPLYSPATVLERLGREYYEAGTGVPQPTLTHWEPVLHPFRLGAGELRKLLGANADPQFIEQLPGYYDHWRQHVGALRMKLALAGYYRQLTGGGGLNTLQSDIQKAAGMSFLKRVEYLLRRDTTMVIGTHGFGPGIENATMVPGLLGKHAYTVLGVEYDANSGTPARLTLENRYRHRILRPGRQGGVPA